MRVLHTSIGFVTVTAVMAANAPVMKPSAVEILTGAAGVPGATCVEAMLAVCVWALTSFRLGSETCAGVRCCARGAENDGQKRQAKREALDVSEQ